MSDGPFATSCTSYAFRKLDDWMEEQDALALRQVAQAVRSWKDGTQAIGMMAEAAGKREIIERFRRWKAKEIDKESPKLKDDREER
jgi:hypothetical protein